MSAAHDVRILNDLIEAVIDSADGYEDAARDEAPAAAQGEFQARAAERRAIVADLQAEVLRLGGRPDQDGGGLIAAAGRAFAGLRDAMAGGDTGALDEAVRGEEALRDRFQTALDDERLTGEVRDFVLRVYDRVKAGHDRTLQLREAAAGRA